MTDTAGDTSADLAAAHVTITINDASNAAPQVDSITVTSSPTPPLTDVAFNASITHPDAGQTLTYDWDFGDGSAHSTDTSPVHQYAAARTDPYTVTVDVADDYTTPAHGQGSATVLVVENHAPDLAQAYVDPAIVAPGGTVSFNADGVSDADADAMDFDWDFGDGSSHFTVANVTDPTTGDATTPHTYSNTIAPYTATLTVTDHGVPPMTSSRDFAVNVTTNRPPDISNAQVSPSSGAAPLTVDLTCTGCADPDGGQTVTYSWLVTLDTQQSSTINGATGSYVFATAGHHQVTLTATDSDPVTPLQVSKVFNVDVSDAVINTGTDPAALVAVCGCSSASPLESLGLLIGLGLVPWALSARRRRR